LFNQNPEKYAPQYGGFCAFGATFGKKFEVDGKAFEIVDGKLYVNKNQQVYAAWRKDIPKHLNEANTEWPEIEFIAANDLLILPRVSTTRLGLERGLFLSTDNVVIHREKVTGCPRDNEEMPKRV
jgi:hypothetical protein